MIVKLQISYDVKNIKNYYARVRSWWKCSRSKSILDFQTRSKFILLNSTNFELFYSTVKDQYFKIHPSVGFERPIFDILMWLNIQFPVMIQNKWSWKSISIISILTCIGHVNAATYHISTITTAEFFIILRRKRSHNVEDLIKNTILTDSYTCLFQYLK